MITKPTVLILGAGASKPYNFPLGTELFDQIRNYLQKKIVNSFHNSIFPKLGFNEVEAIAFSKDLNHCPQSSIDAFLEHRPEFAEMGKALIALKLRELEVSTNLFREKAAEGTRDHWYSYLWKFLETATKEQFKENELSVLTYNYDRTLEQFLINGLQTTYQMNESEIRGVFDSIKFVHLHGFMGNPPPLDPEGLPYDQSVNPDILRQAMKDIKIIGEVTVKDAYDPAYKLLDQAQRICFLGFGYQKENLSRLLKGHWNISQKGWVGGTALGLREIEIQSILKTCRRVPIHISNSYQNLDFLRETGVLDSDGKPHLKEGIRSIH